MGVVLTGKRHEGIFWDDGNVLYFGLVIATREHTDVNITELYTEDLCTLCKFSFYIYTYKMCIY